VQPNSNHPCPHCEKEKGKLFDKVCMMLIDNVLKNIYRPIVHTDPQLRIKTCMPDSLVQISKIEKRSSKRLIPKIFD
jgi:hypothetical protein